MGPRPGEVVELEGATGPLHGWEDTDGDGQVELLFGLDVVQRWPEGTPLVGHGPDTDASGDLLLARPLGDVDGDGLLDHAVGNGIRWGHGAFTGLGGQGHAVPDVDGDGLPDVLVHEPQVYYGPSGTLRLVTGANHRAPRWTTVAPFEVVDGVFLAEVDGVPPLELLVAGTTDHHHYVGLLVVVGDPASRTPRITTSDGARLPGYYQTSAVTRSAGDLDGDGNDEVLFHHPPQLPVVWSLDPDAPRQQVGGVVLDGWRPRGTGPYAYGLGAAADLDGDGTTDLLAPFGWRNGTRVCGMLGLWWGDRWEAPGLALGATDADCTDVGDTGNVPPDAPPAPEPRRRNQCGDGMIFSLGLPLAFVRRRRPRT